MTTTTNRQSRPQLLILLLLSALILGLWQVPWLGWLVFPFRLFGTFVHELSHGLAAVLTGGDFVRFTVHPDLSGRAWSTGGVRIIVASAGYVGSVLFGAGLLLGHLRRWSAPRLLLVLGLALGALCLLFVRNGFGILAGLLLASALILAAAKWSVPAQDWLLRVLALQLLLDGYNSLFTVLLPTTGTIAHTDADTLAEITHLPAFFWVALWLAFSTILAWRLLRLAWINPSAPPIDHPRDP